MKSTFWIFKKNKKTVCLYSRDDKVELVHPFPNDLFQRIVYPVLVYK